MSTPIATVFVVDDDEAVRGALKLLFRSPNIPTTLFASAPEFLARYSSEQPGCLETRSQLSHVDHIRERLESLTPREREVMTLVSSGMANKAMAGELGVSQRTVEIHRARVMEKMQAGSLAHLVRMALELDSSSRRA